MECPISPTPSAWSHQLPVNTGHSLEYAKLRCIHEELQKMSNPLDELQSNEGIVCEDHAMKNQ